MQKLTIVLIIAVMALAVAVPIFADDISDALNGDNTINSSTNNSIADDDSGNNSSIVNDTSLNNTNNTTLTPDQLKTLTDTQGKLTALIATIESLKTTYGNNTKSKGLLNALNQFEKQANNLNGEITAFMQNPTTDNGKINSFVQREAALEHKVAIKQQLLAKQGTQGNYTKENKDNNNSKKDQTKQNNKGHGKGHNK